MEILKINKKTSLNQVKPNTLGVVEITNDNMDDAIQLIEKADKCENISNILITLNSSGRNFGKTSNVIETIQNKISNSQ